MIKTSLIKILLALFFLVLAGCESADDTVDTNPTPKPTAEILHQFGQQTEPVAGDTITVNTGTQVTFTVNATTAPGRTISQYQWPTPLPAGITQVGDINPDNGSLTVQFDNVGEFTLTLTVIDSSAVASEAPAQVIVNVIQSNGAPVVTILHDNGTGAAVNSSNTQININTGTAVKFQALVEDPNGDNISQVQWDFGQLNPTISDPTAEISVSFDTAGSFTVSLSATDSQGLTGTSASVTVMVQDVATQAPDSKITYTLNGNSVANPIDTGATLTFNGEPAGAEYSYVWDFNGAQIVSGNTSGAGPIEVKFTTAKTYSVQLTVGNNGVVDQTPAIVNIIAQDPDASIAYTVNGGASSSGNVSVDTGATIAFSPADVKANYTYNWKFGGAAADASGSGPINVTFANNGVYQIELTAVNQFGIADSSPARISVTVQTPSNLPDASITHTVNGNSGSGDLTIDTGTAVSFDVTPPVNAGYTYNWTFGGAAADASGTHVVVTFDSTGTYSVTLTAVNGNGVADPTPAQINVTVQNPVTPPDASFTYTVNGTSGSGDLSVDTGSAVTFDVSAPIDSTYTYNWTFGGAAADASGTQVIVTFDAVGSYIVKLTAVDGNGVADPTPAQITITVTDPNSNTPSVTILNDGGQGGSVTNSGDLTINDGDIVLYNFTTNIPDISIYTTKWDFDGPDHTTDANGNAVVVYDGSWLIVGTSAAGIYHPTFSLLDGNGTVIASATITVTVLGNPNSIISHDLGSGVSGSSGDLRIAAGTQVKFSASATDPTGSAITAYAWTFSGGTPTPASADAQIEDVLFDAPGQYDVGLTVTNANGGIDPTPATLVVTVLPAFQALPVLSATTQNGSSQVFDISVDADVPVSVVTPNETWLTPMLRYNKLQLPPVIKVARGDNVTVNVTNNLAEDTTIHWHGLKVAAAMDGGPDVPIAANGGTFSYQFDVQQAAAPLWFHPHPDMATGTQVYDGLAGALIVTDSISDGLENGNEIPSGDHDVALLLQDRLFDASTTNGQRNLIYQTSMANGFLGMLGDRILVNDVEMPALHVDTRQYRFRLYNGSNARTYDVALSDGSTFKVVASDGGLLPAPVDSDHLMLAPGERGEIIVDFSTYTPGNSLRLVSNAFNGGMGGGMIALANGAAFDIMSFEVKQTASDPVTLYAALPVNAEIYSRYAAALGFTPIPGQALQAQTTFNERPFVMSVVAGAAGAGPQFLINNTPYDPAVVNETVTMGANGVTEVWTISNSGGGMMMSMAHPFHAHAIQWQILDRSVNGIVSAPQPMDRGWKDTFLVQPGETVRVMGYFDPAVNVGTYMYHCHILEHEDNGMMGVFEVLAAP